MYRNIERKISVPAINGLLAIMLILGSFATANAQATGTRIMLPLVQAGASINQPIDGPFAGYTDLLKSLENNVDTSDVLVVDGSTIEDSTPEVRAADFCREGDGFGRTDWFHSGSDGTLVKRSNQPNTSSCNDINLKIEVTKPWAAGCRVNVLIYANDELKFWGDVQKNRWFEPVSNLRTNWEGLIWVPAACNLSRALWAS